MLAVIPILILIITPVIMLGVRLRKPNFSYFWLLATVASLLAWPFFLLVRSGIPLNIPLVSWQPQELFPVSPALLLDEISWPFALALATLALSTILSDIAHDVREDQPRSEWSDLASILVITVVGILGVMSGNLLTMLLAWAILDLVELVLWLGKAVDGDQSGRIVLLFSTRVAGILLLVWAGMVAYASGLPLSFEVITPEVSPYLLLAAGVRLGVLPINTPLPTTLSLRGSTRNMFRLVPAAANLTLLARTATVGAPATLTPYLLILTALGALYAGLSWASASNELEGLSFWILGMSSMSLAAAVRGHPSASLAWGIALLLPGGLLFLFSTRRRELLPIPLIGALSISALPFTPTWQGVHLYAPPLQTLMLIVLVAQGLLLGGYLRHTIRPSPPISGLERWVWIIYPWGLALLPLTHFAIAWWSRPGATGFHQTTPTWLESWPGLTGFLLAILFLAWSHRGHMISSRLLTILKSILAIQWLYRFTRNAYDVIRRLFSMVNVALEGSAGVLWALLILTLLLSVFVQSVPGG